MFGCHRLALVLPVLLQQQFSTTTKELKKSSYIVVLAYLPKRDERIVGGICVDRFHGPEANVVCRSAGLGFANAYSSVGFFP